MVKSPQTSMPKGIVMTVKIARLSFTSPSKVLEPAGTNTLLFSPQTTTTKQPDHSLSTTSQFPTYVNLLSQNLLPPFLILLHLLHNLLQKPLHTLTPLTHQRPTQTLQSFRIVQDSTDPPHFGALNRFDDRIFRRWNVGWEVWDERCEGLVG